MSCLAESALPGGLQLSSLVSPTPIAKWTPPSEISASGTPGVRQRWGAEVGWRARVEAAARGLEVRHGRSFQRARVVTAGVVGGFPPHLLPCQPQAQHSAQVWVVARAPRGRATLRACTVAPRTLVPWHRGRWQELKALGPEGDEAVGSLPPSATITPADPEGLEAGVPPCGCAESVWRSRWEGAGAGPGPGGLAPESRKTGALTWSPHLHRNWPSVPGPP